MFVDLLEAELQGEADATSPSRVVVLLTHVGNLLQNDTLYFALLVEQRVGVPQDSLVSPLRARNGIVVPVSFSLTDRRFLYYFRKAPALFPRLTASVDSPAALLRHLQRLAVTELCEQLHHRSA